MSRDNDPRDFSRPFLEAAIDSLVRRGDRPELVEFYRSLLPHAADYEIDHRDRDCRRHD